MRKKRPIKRHIVDEVATQEAIVEFYEKRLAEAEEKLGQLLEKHDGA